MFVKSSCDDHRLRRLKNNPDCSSPVPHTLTSNRILICCGIRPSSTPESLIALSQCRRPAASSGYQPDIRALWVLALSFSNRHPAPLSTPVARCLIRLSLSRSVPIVSGHHSTRRMTTRTHWLSHSTVRNDLVSDVQYGTVQV